MAGLRLHRNSVSSSAGLRRAALIITLALCVPSSIAPNVAQARLRVAAACKAGGVRLLDTCIPETVVDSIKLGGMVLECSEQSALIGREYTKRRMPV